MKKTRKWMCFLLVLILALQPVSYVQASGNVNKEQRQTELPELYQTGDTVINPLYAEYYSEEDLQSSLGKRIEVCAEPVEDYTSDLSVLAGQIRDYMIERSGSFKIYYNYDGTYDQVDFEARVNKAFAEALEETDDPHAGDYLKWNWGGYSWEASVSVYGESVYGEIAVTAVYYTTLAQEKEFDQLLSDAMDELDFESSDYTDYDKIRNIYEYICKNVTYDYENLNNNSYKLKQTAYAALKNGTSVCQGYATLLYRMFREADIPVRVIIGDSINSAGETGAHAWNAAELEGNYYLLDSTWDDSSGGTDYFLKGTENFNIDHFVDKTECQFYDELEISEKDYEASEYSYKLEVVYNKVTESNEYFIYKKDKKGNIIEKYSRIEIFNADGAYFVTPNGDYLEETMYRFPEVEGAEDMLWYIDDEAIEFSIVTEDGYNLMYDAYYGKDGSITPEWNDSTGISTIAPGNGNISMQLWTMKDESGDSDENGDDEEVIVYDGITIDGLKLSDNAKTLTAGDSFTLTITLKNNKDVDIDVNSGDFYVSWEIFSESGKYYSYNEYGAGEYLNIPANGTADLVINHTTSAYTFAGERRLSRISYFGDELNEGISYNYDSYTDMFIGTNQTGIDVHEMSYQGEANWIISTADNADIEAPLIKNVSVVTDHIEAPGTAKIRMILADEGPAKIDVISYTFRDVKNSRNNFYGYARSDNLVPVDGGYEFEIELPLNLIAATYKLENIAVTDQNQESRDYWISDDNKMYDSDDNTFESINLVVDEAECKDDDFELPIIKGMTFASSVKAGKDLEIKVDVLNEDDIEYIGLRFTNDSGYLDIISKSVKKNSDGTFTCLVPISSYAKAGEYRLDRIRVEDASIRQNITLFYYDEYDKNLYSPTTYDVYDYSGDTKITVVGSDANVTSEGQLSEAIKNAPNGSTVALTGDFTYENKITAENLLAAKAKGLKLIITCVGFYSEIEIDTKDVPDDFKGELIAGSGRSNIMKKLLYIEGQEKPDKQYFPFDIIFTADEIPFTIRMQISDKFKNHDIKVVGYKDTKEQKLVANGLSYNDGFVEYKFENGIASEITPVQDGRYLYYYGYISCSEELLVKEHVKATVQENFAAATMNADGFYDMVTYCEECGEELERTTYTIDKIASVKLSASTYTYNGKVRKPSVTVKDSKGNVLKAGTDYTLSGAGVNGKSAVGRYAVKVTFKGNYKGTQTLYYVIAPKAADKLSVIRYQYGNKLLWTWNAPAGGASGYRVRYKLSTASSYTTKYVTAKTFTISGLKENKKYVCKVTPYYNASNGTKYYGAEKTVNITTVAKGKILNKVNKPAVTKYSSGKVKIAWKNIANESGYEISKATTAAGTTIVATVAGANVKNKVLNVTKNKKYYYKVRAYRTVGGKKIYGAWSAVNNFTVK